MQTTQSKIKTRTLALGLVVLALTAVSALLNSGCAGCANDLKKMHAGITGLHKKITLYGNNGTPIREWTTTTATDDKGGTCFFLTSDDKAVTVSGTFVIEEVP